MNQAEAKKIEAAVDELYKTFDSVKSNLPSNISDSFELALEDASRETLNILNNLE